MREPDKWVGLQATPRFHPARAPSSPMRPGPSPSLATCAKSRLTFIHPCSSPLADANVSWLGQDSAVWRRTIFRFARSTFSMHVVVNAAMSVDGKLSTRRREQVTISSERDFTRVYRLRGEADAIGVGIGTVLADDPSLTTHDEEHRRTIHQAAVDPPARIVFDSLCRTPPDAAILAGAPTTYIVTSEAAPPDRQNALQDAGASLMMAGTDRVDLSTACSTLEANGIEDLLVEGGGELIFSFFEANLVDQLSLYMGGLLIGGRDAPTLADGEGFIDSFPALELTRVDRLDNGIVTTWTVR